MLIEQEDEVDGLGELGASGILGVVAEPAVVRIELAGQAGAAPRGQLADQGVRPVRLVCEVDLAAEVVVAVDVPELPHVVGQPAGENHVDG